MWLSPPFDRAWARPATGPFRTYVQQIVTAGPMTPQIVTAGPETPMIVTANPEFPEIWPVN